MRPKRSRGTVDLDEVPVEPEAADEVVDVSGLSSGGPEQLAWCAQWTLPDQYVQVLNVKKGLVHLYAEGLEQTACGVMKCKRPTRPARKWRFATSAFTWSADNAPYDFCLKCYGCDGSVFSKAKIARVSV